jgi:hypothetical protein
MEQRKVMWPDPLAGLPLGIAMRLRRKRLRTRAQVATWYRQGEQRWPITRIGPKAQATIAAWLAADVKGEMER